MQPRTTDDTSAGRWRSLHPPRGGRASERFSSAWWHPRCSRGRGPGDEYIDLLRAYIMQTDPYQKAISKRKVWIEPLFAEGKLWHGMRRFRMRTLEKVNIEALMIAAGQNIKRLLSFGDHGPRRLAQGAALRPPQPTLVRTDRTAWRCRSRLHLPCASRFSTGWFVLETWIPYRSGSLKGSNLVASQEPAVRFLLSHDHGLTFGGKIGLLRPFRSTGAPPAAAHYPLA